MEHFDHDYVQRLLFRLSRIKPDAVPAWGKLNRDGLVRHLADSLRYSMGGSGDLPDKSNWLSRTIIKPIILNRIIRLPKNLPAPYRHPEGLPPDDMEMFHSLLEEYLALIQAGELQPKPHPFLGSLTIDEWARLHVIHFDHHLRQFGV